MPKQRLFGPLFSLAWLETTVLIWMIIFGLSRLLIATFPSDIVVRDFFQDWSSARSVLDGNPVFNELYRNLFLYLDLNSTRDGLLVTVNAHPPASVLLFLPFGLLSYKQALTLWNLLSLTLVAFALSMIQRGLGLKLRDRGMLRALACIVLSYPLYQQVDYGQMSGLIMLLLIGVWKTGRDDRPIASGTLLGLAISLKFYPLLLFIYFVGRRRWMTLATGIASFLAFNFLALAVLVYGAISQHARVVLPEVQGFRFAWDNASVVGLTSKLLESPPENLRRWDTTVPLWIMPRFALGLTLIFCGSITVLTLRRSSMAEVRDHSDLGYGLTLVAMLLTSPITWNHYFLPLVLPLALLWREHAQSFVHRLPLFLASLLVWYDPTILWNYCLGVQPRMPAIAHPIDTVAILSLPFYGLMMIYHLLLSKLGAVPLSGSSIDGEMSPIRDGGLPP